MGTKVCKPGETATESPQEGFLSQEDLDYAESLAASPQASPAPAAATPGPIARSDSPFSELAARAANWEGSPQTSSGPGSTAPHIVPCEAQAGPAPGKSETPASNIPPAQPEALPAPHEVAGPPGEQERQCYDMKLWLEDHTGCSIKEIDAYLDRNLTPAERSQNVLVMERLRALQQFRSEVAKKAILGGRA